MFVLPLQRPRELVHLGLAHETRAVSQERLDHWRVLVSDGGVRLEPTRRPGARARPAHVHVVLHRERQASQTPFTLDASTVTAPAVPSRRRERCLVAVVHETPALPEPGGSPRSAAPGGRTIGRGSRSVVVAGHRAGAPDVAPGGRDEDPESARPPRSRAGTSRGGDERPRRDGGHRGTREVRARRCEIHDVTMSTTFRGTSEEEGAGLGARMLGNQPPCSVRIPVTLCSYENRNSFNILFISRLFRRPYLLSFT